MRRAVGLELDEQIARRVEDGSVLPHRAVKARDDRVVSAGRQLDSSSDLSISGYLNYFDNGSPGASDVQSAGISAAYSRRFWRGLTGTAAAGLNAFDQDGFNSQLIGSALVGLRYNF